MTLEITLLETRTEQQTAVKQLATDGRYRIQIFSYDLDPFLFGTDEFVQACKSLAIRHPNCFIQILIQDNENLKHQSHRLISLLQRLPSRISLKKAHEDFSDHTENFMIVDDSGIFLKRKRGTRAAAEFSNQHKRLADEYQRLFQQIWDASEIDSSIRRLSI